ncbi:intraflagellar transport complex b, subunit 20 domain-containing protein [Ditylenchus destructor]|uniref:Intraflagellar transport complex b, subunit 20 domain-containing protein n=1 Tax=Ditylenchus destructor TaxID=166010 RepID=A0AAD4N537_9BILA|nr:intraflagellar transport complex b, subunit 20 domain-containing protein [Ditylenchus destructor]
MTSVPNRDQENDKVFIDDLNRIRLANPDVLESSNALKEESEQFIGQIDAFNSLVQNVRTTLEEVGKISDGERLRALASQNELRKAASGDVSQHEAQQLQILIRERQMELERLKVELESYRRIEAQQLECLQRLRSS